MMGYVLIQKNGEHRNLFSFQSFINIRGILWEAINNEKTVFIDIYFICWSFLYGVYKRGKYTDFY